ncbi:MAG: LysR family transcriptional regulator [Lachnospiraceae bacterium]|nr:LysR family transcriptional regulator [Lachnospiraceae bacterium]
MELKQIEYFLHLAESEHMSQTADMLNIAQPTLSRSMSALEKELGIRLFDRVGNRLHLNRSGEQFYKYAREALELLHTANLSARQSMYETTGNVRIHCMTFSAILLPCIRDYMSLNPRVDIKLNQYTQIHGEETSSDACDLVLTCDTDGFAQNKGEQFWVE